MGNKENQIEYPETPFWTPLESAVGDRCREFMFMGQILHQGTLIFLYKNIISRAYLNLDIKDQAYQFKGGGYLPISKEEAIKHVFDRGITL
jgi:hypothetical protein